MKTTTTAALAVLAFGLANAQPAPQPPASSGPAPTGIVIGSGNYFSPIVANLDAAVAFYRDGLGLDVQAAPADASANPALRNMFGLPDANLRWQIARTPAAPGGVEIIEVTNAGGTQLDRGFADVGAATLIVTVRDLDATFARLQKLGAPVVTRGGAPIALERVRTSRSVVVKDPAGHFVEVLQTEPLPETQAPAAANVVAVRLCLTVADVETSVRMYGDALGMKVIVAPTSDVPSGVAALFGVAAAPVSVAGVQVPTSGVVLELAEFAGAKAVLGKIQDPGSTRMQLRVNDIEAAIAAFERFGGEVVSTGGVPLELPAGTSTLKVAIVRDPNNFFVVLIQAPPPAA